MYSEFVTKEVIGGKVQNKKSKSNLIILSVLNKLIQMTEHFLKDIN